MTWSRRIALFCMHRYKWYNPRLGQEPEEEEQETDHVMSRDDDESDTPSQTNQAYPFTHSKRETPSLEKGEKNIHSLLFICLRFLSKQTQTETHHIFFFSSLFTF